MTPNWKLDSDYEFVKQLDGFGLAWEFMRRGKAYRKAWLDFCTEVAPLVEKFGPYLHWRDNAAALSEPGLWDFSPPINPGETVKHWEERTFYLVGAQPTKTPLPELRGRAWRLKRMYDPYATAASEVEFLPPATAPLVWHRWEDVIRIPEAAEVFEVGAYVLIDLTLPLDKQLEYLGNVLGKKQQQLLADGDVVLHPSSETKIFHKLMPHYLQLLDADNLAVPAKDIAVTNIDQNYYPDKNKSLEGLDPVEAVKTRLKAARDFAEWKFWFLFPRA